jgi:hypothetical protein
MAGTLSCDTIQNGAGATVPTTTVISGSAKAWVNFNGQSGSVAIRGSFNVSSITYNTTGDYTVNFINALADANYSVSGMAAYTNTVSDTPFYVSGPHGTITATQFRFRTCYTYVNVADCLYVMVSFFR